MGFVQEAWYDSRLHVDSRQNKQNGTKKAEDILKKKINRPFLPKIMKESANECLGTVYLIGTNDSFFRGPNQTWLQVKNPGL